MGVLARVPRGARRRWSASSRARSNGSPVTGSWCSSTIPCRATTRPSARSTWRWRCETGTRPRRGWRARARPRFRGRDRAGLCDPGPDRFRGTLRLRRNRHVSNIAARLCAEAESVADAGHSRGAGGGRVTLSVAEPVGESQPQRVRRAVAVHNVKGASTRKQVTHEQTSGELTVPAQPTRCPTSTNPRATRRSTTCNGAAAVWEIDAAQL